MLCLLAVSSSGSISPGPERSEDVSVDDRLGSSSSVGCGWYIMGAYRLKLRAEKEIVLTDFLWWQHGCAVLATARVGTV